MPPCPASSARRRRVVLALGLCGFVWPFDPAWAQDNAGAVSVAVPIQSGTYDFHDSTAASPAQRLRDAPLPEPSTVPKPDNSLHDPATGADTTAFGSAYTYPNPLNDTTSGSNTVANSASKSAGLQQRSASGLVVFEWGYPPPPMPKVAGDDLTAAPPPVTQIRFAVQADDEATLDARSLWIVQRAVQAYGRAGLTEITIERPSHTPDCCARYADLVRAELIRNGLGPDPVHLLPGHRIRLVLATMPAAR
jgi:hypothetical protein